MQKNKANAPVFIAQGMVDENVPDPIQRQLLPQGTSPFKTLLLYTDPARSGINMFGSHFVRGIRHGCETQTAELARFSVKEVHKFYNVIKGEKFSRKPKVISKKQKELNLGTVVHA